MPCSDDSTTGLVDLSPSVETFLEDVLSGLRRPDKRLPCKYFYDARGSRLFEEICELDEYYLTRTELAILREHAAEMADALGSDVMLIEPGSGSSRKTRLVLDGLDGPAAYVPVDISRDHLIDVAGELAGRYPGLQVLPVSADFTEPFDLPEPERTPQRRVIYFPGSTIGNFDPPAAVQLLRRFADLCGKQGALLIGIDLQKDATVLEAAYNDAAGVTAEFNRNLLRRINGELNADFDLDGFAHRAIYNAEDGRIEMSLDSTRAQTVALAGETFAFRPGEAICTEYSHKYTVEQFASYAAAAGFVLTKRWTDPRDDFAVLLLETA
ncbi:MAG: L-histidine N(alpha)-methyltransferase [Planctomycetaceae bacterium]